MTDILNIQDKLSQHIEQAKAIVDYLAADIACNDSFSANKDIIANTLWAVQTLLENASNSQGELFDAIKEVKNGTQKNHKN
ncbi:hypothetical protein [Caviibacterium pharyngocola]|uniref:Uncharacterized protein n=1 Tax=Caviibacterium pharyngocola TaxID=28159 RepID=A0A2M8RSV5_9PAST|nr:hypothetical protein [Caviibacterium pharyngocola]PJG81971.1 hypothetical protein CVP04_11360 [Caviibacterium pharyngocola]